MDPKGTLPKRRIEIRRPPLVEYEKPVLDSFRQATGLDATRLDDRDPRWLEHRAGVLTVRRQLDLLADDN